MKQTIHAHSEIEGKIRNRRGIEADEKKQIAEEEEEMKKNEK